MQCICVTSLLFPTSQYSSQCTTHSVSNMQGLRPAKQTCNNKYLSPSLYFTLLHFAGKAKMEIIRLPGYFWSRFRVIPLLCNPTAIPHYHTPHSVARSSCIPLEGQIWVIGIRKELLPIKQSSLSISHD